MGNFPYGFFKCQISMRVKMSIDMATCLSELGNTTHASKQTCSYLLPGLASCRKANIGLGGLGDAVWIRKQRGCERALFRMLSPRKPPPPPRPLLQDNLQSRPKDRFHCAARWDATYLKSQSYVVLKMHKEIQDYKSHLVHLYFMFWNLMCFR